MSFPRYEHYKESGVDWLGEVPEGWGISRLGFESWVRARLGWKGLKAEEYVEDGFVFLATPNIKGLCIDFENVNYINEHRYEESPEIRLREGDVLLAKDGSTLGTVNVVRSLPRPATVNSSIAVITPNQTLRGVFLYYLFQSTYMDNTIQRIKGGMGVPHLFQWDLNKFYMPLPPTNEQHAIAAFLDRETTKIDALISEQQRLIALLAEKRQATIFYAVTKGLNPDAPMKDSGIEWLGKVPERWQVLKLKRVASLRSGEGITSAQISTDGEFPVFGGNGLRGYGDSYTHEGRYAIIGRQGALCGNINYAEGKFWASEHAVVVSPMMELITTWIGELLRSMNLNQYSVSAAQPGLSVEAVGNLLIPFPPISEQSSISAFLDYETAQIDTLTAEAQRVITLLQERRTALVSAAVTGEIDVRGYANSSAMEAA